MKKKPLLYSLITTVFAFGILLFAAWPVSFRNDPAEAAPCSCWLIYDGERYCFHYEYHKSWFPPAGYDSAGALTLSEAPDEELECTFATGELYYNEEEPGRVCIRLEYWNRFTSAYAARYLILEQE